MPRRARLPIPIDVQVRVLYRDGWLCSLCGRPTIFHLALKYLDEFVHANGYNRPTAYFHDRWRRDAAPLLDELGSMIDHVEAFASGGRHAEDNFAVACAKCNGRKSSQEKSAYLRANPPRLVKAKYGEPRYWDGLVGVFLVFAKRAPERLSLNERKWARELERYLESRAAG